MGGAHPFFIDLNPNEIGGGLLVFFISMIPPQKLEYFFSEDSHCWKSKQIPVLVERSIMYDIGILLMGTSANKQTAFPT